MIFHRDIFVIPNRNSAIFLKYSISVFSFFSTGFRLLLRERFPLLSEVRWKELLWVAKGRYFTISGSYFCYRFFLVNAKMLPVLLWFFSNAFSCSSKPKLGQICGRLLLTNFNPSKKLIPLYLIKYAMTRVDDYM